ncbi:OmpA family protein [Spirochaeta thermophila]|uniref:OmpA family protein n=1 Tax=Winmispira thermophila (strain ATCC 49972 / DSM 6192 / RI 19.B1) TaxID=665571 RepID=E0RSV1_WINT6|nr:OmpA family protein [Spirochaeta thermophila]ADN02088.1 OmpA family protein [Spirochaeta thermophila DSM 6192]
MRVLFFFLILLGPTLLSAEPALLPIVRVVEKHNYALTRNGRYQGHLYREMRGRLEVEPSPHGPHYRGTAFLLERFTHLAPSVPRRVDEAIEVDLYPFAPRSAALPSSPFPSHQGIPLIPEDGIPMEGSWQGPGTVYVDPEGKGTPTRVDVLVEYRFQGTTWYEDEEVLVLWARFGLRYRGDDPGGDPKLARSEGSHVLTIYLSKEGVLRFMKDTFDDRFLYRDGTVVAAKGFSLIWYREVVPFQPGTTITLLSERLSPLLSSPPSPAPEASLPPSAPSLAAPGERIPSLGEENSVEEVPEGIKITLRTLHFLPDQAVLLPGEEEKLDLLAEALNAIPDRTILVVGHTADVGKPRGQMALSEARAKTIVEELVKRGVKPERLIYLGKGGTEPVAPNDTEEGRRLNRRVEIFVLED